jgi:hypothetical protein
MSSVPDHAAWTAYLSLQLGETKVVVDVSGRLGEGARGITCHRETLADDCDAGHGNTGRR